MIFGGSVSAFPRDPAQKSVHRRAAYQQTQRKRREPDIDARSAFGQGSDGCCKPSGQGRHARHTAICAMVYSTSWMRSPLSMRRMARWTGYLRRPEGRFRRTHIVKRKKRFMTALFSIASAQLQNSENCRAASARAFHSGVSASWSSQAET